MRAWLWGWEDGTRNSDDGGIRYRDRSLAQAYRRGYEAGLAALAAARVDAEYIFRYH